MVFGRYDYAAFATFAIYAAGSVVVPVALVAVAVELGFSLESGGMAAGGMLHLGRTISMVIAMLLCGFAAGRWGTRRSLGWSVALMGIGMALAAMAPAYGVLFLALMVAGLGEGTIEGLATPFVQDLHDEEPGRYINFSHAFWSVGVFITVLLAGYLLTMGVSWRVITGAVAFAAVIPTLMILLPSRSRHARREHHQPMPWRVVWNNARVIARRPRFWLFYAAMFVAGGGEFCLTFWCASYIQLHFAAAAWAGGVGTACFAAGMFLGRTGWGYLLRQDHLSGLVIGSAIVGAVVTVALPAMQSMAVFFGLLFLSGVATAPFWPSIQSYATTRLDGTDSTMLLILLSCAGVPGCGILAWLMGVLGNHVGLNAAFYLVPACYIVLAGLMVYETRRQPARAPAPAPVSSVK